MQPKKIKDKQSNITSEMIDACQTEQEILTLKETIEANLIEVKRQLGEAQGRAAANLEYSDPIWYAKANSYKRVLGFLHQRILMKQREMRHKKSCGDINKLFVDVAKEHLPAETFYSIFGKAKELSIAEVA